MEKDTDSSRFFELTTTVDKIYVNKLNLNGKRNEVLHDYKCDFEFFGLMGLGPVKNKTNIRFRNVNDFESFINAIDIEYDTGDVTFTGFLYKLNTPQLNSAKRSAYAKGTNYFQEIVEYHGQSCYIPTSGNYFIKCINYFSEKIIQKNFRISLELNKDEQML